MFFESIHSEKQSEFHYHFGESLDFPLHIHRSFEFFSQLQGKTLVVIDGKEYELKEGEAVLIFPLQTHSYKTITKGKHAISIFSSD
ncbi:MAG: AraC family ligand binding domain-containing protein, partial [Clostridia bacterium]|nr:AraC family ligand binding domain-containing protein [Clostridia bacterium]